MFKNDYKGKNHIILIGAGGTGGWFASFLHRIKDENIVTIIDGDHVEQKNLSRQNFMQNDIDKNKAQAIGDRFEFDNIVPQFLTNKDELKQIVESIEGRPIIIGAVDNNGSRKLVHEFMTDYDKHAIWIDAGNTERDGQMIIHILDEKGQTFEKFDSPINIYNEVFSNIEGDERRPDQISCAEQSESAPQNVAANVMSGTTLFVAVNKLLAGEPLFNNEIKFSSNMMTMVATS